MTTTITEYDNTWTLVVSATDYLIQVRGDVGIELIVNDTTAPTDPLAQGIKLAPLEVITSLMVTGNVYVRSLSSTMSAIVSVTV